MPSSRKHLNLLNSFSLYFVTWKIFGIKKEVFLKIAGEYTSFINYIKALTIEASDNCLALLQCNYAIVQRRKDFP